MNIRIGQIPTLAALACSFVGFASCAIAEEQKTITIATEASYAPYAFKDTSGKMVGFEIDLVADLCPRMAVKCNVVDQAYDSLIPSLVSGRFDAVMAAMGITAAREKVISFSSPYVITPMGFVTTRDSQLVGIKAVMSALDLDEVSPEEKAAIDKMASDLQSKTVGVQVGTNFETFMKKFMPTVRLSTYNTTDEMILDLDSGRIDAGLASYNFLKPLIDKPQGKNLTIFGPSMTNGPFGSRVAVGIRKDNSELRSLFDKAIGEAVADGTVSKLSTKWFGYDNSPKK